MRRNSRQVAPGKCGLRALLAVVVAAVVAQAPVAALGSPARGPTQENWVYSPDANGTVTGIVTGLKVCNAPGGPLESAQVSVTGNGGYHQTLTTDRGGRYSISLDPGLSPLTITATRSGYAAQTATGITVESGETTTANMELSFDTPCLAAPAALVIGQPPDVTAAIVLHLGNAGAHLLTWSIAEKAPAAPAGGSGALAAIDLILDGDFESGIPDPYWEEYSEVFGSPLCTPGRCGLDNYAHAGSWWVWFGGTGMPEEAAITQTVWIPSGTAGISFWAWLQHTTGFVTDTMRFLVDGQPLWTIDGSSSAYAAGYTRVTLDLTAYADGGLHAISFDSDTDDPEELTGTSFMLDDVALIAQPQGCTGDIPWLTVQPTAGTIPPGGATAVTLGFDSSGLALGQIYAGRLCVMSDDPRGPIAEIPVSLLVARQVFLPAVQRPVQ